MKQKTDTAKPKKGLQYLSLILIYIIGTAAALFAALLIKEVHHSAFHEAALAVSPSALTKLLANDTFAACLELFTASLVLCLSFIFANALANHYLNRK